MGQKYREGIPLIETNYPWLVVGRDSDNSVTMATCLHNHSQGLQDIENILEVARDWALTHGLVYKPDTSPEGVSRGECAPFALFPSVVPRTILQQAAASMTHFNTLMYRVAQDHEFLEQSLKSVIKVDPFVRNLWDIYNKVRDEGKAQTISLDLFRNDFMMNVSDSGVTTSAGIPPASALQLKQIEFNTIAASFGGLIGATTDLHRYTLDLAGKAYTSAEMPDNAPAEGFAAGIVKAWELYGNQNAVVLFLVSGIESNIIDQRWLEFKVHRLNSKIRVVRNTLLGVHTAGTLSDDGKFFLDKLEVAVVYFRAGYGEDSYSSDNEWRARLLMERSRSIKCPTVRSQLSGCKKVQQCLAQPGALQRFLKDPAVVTRVKETFAGLYSLDQGPEGDKAVQMAIQSPDKYVLKPQREGGGHNLYGAEMKQRLEAVGDSPEREAYILMERIIPLPQHNFLVKAGLPPALLPTVSELGIYGVHIGDGDKEIMNAQSGHMLRTKTQGTDEGGIVVGFAVLDSPFVVDV